MIMQENHSPTQLVADMHTHTTCSDGALSPMQLVEKAEAKGFTTLAITDHDNMNAYRTLLEGGYNGKVRVVPGVEISCYDFGREVHILAYFLDHTSTEVREYETFYREDRIRRAHEMVENLRACRVNISIQEVLDEANGATGGRPHVAAILLRKHVVSTIQQAFDIYLDVGKPGYAPKTPFPIAKAVEMVHRAGGILSVAHPGRYFTNPTSCLQLIETGVDAIEVYHPSHWYVTREFYRVLCSQHNLLITGGSDFHGTREYDEQNFGVFGVSESALKLLEDRRDVVRQSQPA
jgi:predicted metal-dependent phosphoesterase TrpH